MKSKDVEQLMGIVKSVEQLKTGDCDPVFEMKDLGFTKSYAGFNISADQPANPCGLIARSMFNDTYKISVV